MILMMITKSEIIENLIKEIKNGDRKATEELLRLFNPLICKTSEQIYVRYGKIFPLDEVIRQGRCALVYLTVIEYQIGGKAHYPYFIKKKLHAYLVQLYRPIFTASLKSVPIDEMSLPSEPSDQPCIDERHEIYEKLIGYIETNFDTREKGLVYEYICGHIPISFLAGYYHISRTRMIVIHKRMIKKLRGYLAKLGICTKLDI